VGGIKYKMNVGWVEVWNPTPDYVTLPLTLDKVTGWTGNPSPECDGSVNTDI